MYRRKRWPGQSLTRAAKRVLALVASAGAIAALLWLLPTPLNWVLGVVATIVLNWLVPRVLDEIWSSAAQGRPIQASQSRGPIHCYHQSSTPQDFVFDVPPETLPKAPPEWQQDRSPWGYGLGAVDADGTEVQIVIEARDGDAVVVRGLLVHVLERQDPIHGYVLRQIAGDLVDVRYADVDLDADPPVIALGSGHAEGQGNWEFPLKVTGSSPEVLHVFAATRQSFCSWTAELLYTYKGEQGTITIDSNGEPFRTTSTQNAAEYVLLADGSIMKREDLFGSS